MSQRVEMILDVNEKPKSAQWILLSFQHVFAMFGATILVPVLTGFPISVALFASGIGTIVYSCITRFKVPVYLGSSFAYISAVQIAVAAMSGDVSAAQSGLILIGLVYVIVSILVRFIGKDWIDKLLPPIVIGPMIAVIGLGLAAESKRLFQNHSVSVRNLGRLCVCAGFRHCGLCAAAGSSAVRKVLVAAGIHPADCRAGFQELSFVFRTGNVCDPAGGAGYHFRAYW